MPTNDAWTGDQVESAFGRCFEEFYDTIGRLFDLLDEAVPAVSELRRRWDDVGNLASTLQIPPEHCEGFVAVWEAEFGTKRFAPIVAKYERDRRAAFQRATNNESAADDSGHRRNDEQLRSADYRQSVTAFISAHGSMASLQRAIRRYTGIRRHVDTIARSSIVFAVGALEKAIAEIERVRLHRHVEAMTSSEKEFSLDELMDLRDISIVIDDAVERRVEKLCYGSLRDWRAWFQKAFSTDIETLALDWAALEEVVQCRHIIAHNGGRVSRLYQQRTGRTDVSIGKVLPIGPAYVTSSLDQVAILGFRMLSVAWKKLGVDVDHRIRHTSNRCYDMLLSERWQIAQALADELLASAGPSAQEALRGRVNSWLARVGQGEVESVRTEVEAWEVGGLAEVFKIAKCALLGQRDALFDGLPRAIERRELTRGDLLTWPLFQDLREDPRFASLLAAVPAVGPPSGGESLDLN